ncbi:hypothetical protein H0H81_012665 [Sphagnurus paluster]|uniref:Uncharacterized protein n=1 Tax=Sphagnurus paluster TaxID=117069 RepID=A0A9P7KJ16_9AGAR|nr:hypothetical protein H0H81_012665 [Sphagnurus paluster]
MDDNEQHFDNFHWNGIPDPSDDGSDAQHNNLHHLTPPLAHCSPQRQVTPLHMPMPRPARDALSHGNGYAPPIHGNMFNILAPQKGKRPACIPGAVEQGASYIVPDVIR